MKRNIALWGLAALICFGFFYLTNERNPTFRPQVTTFDGKPSIGCLHRDGTYTFYNVVVRGDGSYEQASEIASFPSSEAAKLH